ncbi:vWA domain-containing protein [Anaeromicropila populeti]|uniref:Predicted metal-dependent peptidase n=1 Tax=Anaeromicropila populeti TaxID=37658 RepID=A0A1I6IR33_9FIRM|nr:VWA-like domain-containing protein [Anaeromicropila populeti]SFR69193.1 Predicted metal-dependent peptidase [Anaeromicropila populeti]
MKNEIKERLINICNQILKASRNELYLSMRFLDVALSQFSYEFLLSTFYMGTDGEKIYYNPKFLTERYEFNRILVNRSYFHMLLHCIFFHIYNYEDKNEELWDISCDIAVEYIMDGMDYKCIQKLISDYRKQIYASLEDEQKILTAEGIYKVLLSGRFAEQDIVKIGLEFLVDDHTLWRKKKKGGQNEEPESRKAPEEEYQRWEKVSETIKTNLETYFKNAGNESRALMDYLNVKHREQYNYRSFLRRFALLREENKMDMDSFDYGFYHYGLELYQNMPLIEPLEYSEVNKIEEFVIAIDTSGSCQGETVKAFLEETFTILLDSENFFNKVNVHVIQCDNEIKEDMIITDMEQIEDCIKGFSVKGYGGTDFRPVFQYVDDLIKRKELHHLKGLLYFTDGMGVYPTKPPGYEVAFVFIEENYTDKKVPPWAMKLIIEPDDLRQKRKE